MTKRFTEDGFIFLPGYFCPRELSGIEKVVRRFHRLWLRGNRRGYRDGLVNSAYLTAREGLPATDRHQLFSFIGQHKLMRLARPLLAGQPTFINTQLFFAPYDPGQKNYWHRDIQFTGLNEEQQQEALQLQQVLHLRIALANDPGLELVPGSHRRWDTELEHEVRLGLNGRHSWDDLPEARRQPMRAGDLLVFSANMLHRAIYDQSRFSLDIVLSDPDPAVTRYVQLDCLPERQQAGKLRRLVLFNRARRHRL
ncbi:MAG: phytanoyl-CoA dioxygenase family protein [Pseudomonas sp.]